MEGQRSCPFCDAECPPEILLQYPELKTWSGELGLGSHLISVHRNRYKVFGRCVLCTHSFLGESIIAVAEHLEEHSDKEWVLHALGT